MPYDSSGDHIWLTTAERTPYFYAEGNIVTQLGFTHVGSLLASEFKTYDMIDRQTKAFGINSSATSPFDLLLVHDDMKFAFIWIIKDEHALNEKICNTLELAGKAFDEKSARMESVLAKSGLEIKLENRRFGMQISLQNEGS